VARIHDVVFDCGHPASIARFWAAVLDGYDVAPYDEAELARLRERGINDPEDDPMVLVEAGPGDTPRLLFQLVTEPRSVKNRVHLDLRGDDIDAEIERAIRLGARVVASYEHLTTMADPEGNEFCFSRR
jgi:hypothetical protein